MYHSRGDTEPGRRVEHLLRAHCGRPEEESGQREETARAPCRRVVCANPLRRRDQRREPERGRRHVRPDLECRLDEHQGVGEKEGAHAADATVAPQGSEAEREREADAGHEPHTTASEEQDSDRTRAPVLDVEQVKQRPQQEVEPGGMHLEVVAIREHPLREQPRVVHVLELVRVEVAYLEEPEAQQVCSGDQCDGRAAH